ncbi:branched-chain amino acid transport system ATP-binding protein [Halobacillus dabanensis]|uniref:Branched-chain amino acid transport system ATP-binding protein n=1 Tax=Halobacillus dabanensis TaxID=240302 RepID=A0A1I3XWK5_HALDA|nr:ABC transporter ATP-binding protein [Halobacillus dabanensis]SFK23451.1 branched-chain amino acid transport system ATP-binding protein [Halobacillus dabanensis]
MLHVDNIEVVYSKMILVLKGMSLQVPDGKIVALLGSNGAGKSTTLKAISGLLGGDGGQVTKGKIVYEEKDITAWSPDKIVQQGVFQSMEGRRVFKHLTVEENLMAGAHSRKDRRNIKKDMERVYHYFPKLKDLNSRHAGLLSGGEQQMLAIGRGIMAKPKMLLLDEPSLGIAPLLVKEIFKNIKQINEEEGMSILVVEQNANVALSIADYGYIIEDGRSVMEAPVSELLTNQEVQEHYLGMSEEGRKNYREVKAYRKKQRWI